MTFINSTFSPGDATGFPLPPVDYAVTFESIAPGLTSLAEQSRSDGESWISAIERILPVVAASKLQSDLIRLQLEQAKNGLPPIDMANYGIGVNAKVGIDAQTMYLIGGVLLAVVLAVYLSKRR